MRFLLDAQAYHGGILPYTGSGLVYVSGVEMRWRADNRSQYVYVSVGGLGQWHGYIEKLFFSYQPRYQHLFRHFLHCLGFTDKQIKAGIEEKDMLRRVVFVTRSPKKFQKPLVGYKKPFKSCHSQFRKPEPSELIGIVVPEFAKAEEPEEG